MSSSSNENGRAFEYICLKTLEDEISKYRPVEVKKDSNFDASKNAWESVRPSLKKALAASARSAVKSVFDLEPLITESGDDTLNMYIRSDEEGEKGDVRDIVISRKNIRWEIGLSLKHNNFAVKHSRLGDTIDFGQRWFGVPCSEEYWKEVRPVFDMLLAEKRKRTKWRDLPGKERNEYVPLLKAFVNEVKRSNAKHGDLPGKMVEYLLGEYDFYKIISMDYMKMAQIQTFNLRGGLNKNSLTRAPKISVPKSSLPTKIISLDFRQGSTNTVEMYMDGGWQFSFRIHNASAYVETSLKFDVQIIRMPATVVTMNCHWE